MHDVKLWKSGESRALRSVLRNHAEGYALLCFHFTSVPGWNDATKHLKTKVSFWHKLWCDAGSPSAGVLHQLKLATKRRYKYEVRRLKWQQSAITRRRMAHALPSSGSHNFWKEVKKVNSSGSLRSAHAPVIDGMHGDSDIANVFSSKLSSLLSSASSSSSDSLLVHFNDDLTGDDLNSVSVPSSCIRSAFHLLKPHKADGTSLVSDHLIFALPAIEEFVASLFTGILRHGYMPAALRDCILVPIPKDPTSSDNYRPVALAPTLSKP